MNTTQTLDCNQPAGAKLERVRFFDRQLLTAEDMTTDRDYFLQKLRRHNRFLHGWGVVCGLPVTASPTAASPWRVQIGSGYALGPFGDEIFVGEAVYFDLAACLTGGVTNPCEPSTVNPTGAGTSSVAYLGIKYAECEARPVQAATAGCDCDDDACQYSRIRDSFQIQCLTRLPPSPPPVSLCEVVRGGIIAPCPPCPTEPWVVLAKINLPSATTMNITNTNIDNFSVRRVLLGTAVLQDQIVRCCCGPASSSSSSSGSSLGAIPGRPAIRKFALDPAKTGIVTGQRVTRVPGSPGSAQIALTLMNSTSTTVENVVAKVSLSPVLSADMYNLSAAEGWDTANLQHLQSRPIALEPGKAQTLSFQVAPVGKSAAFSVTSSVSVSTGTSGVSGAAYPVQATIGG